MQLVQERDQIPQENDSLAPLPAEPYGDNAAAERSEDGYRDHVVGLLVSEVDRYDMMYFCRPIENGGKP